MASMHIDPRWPETSWFRPATAAPDAGEFADLDASPPPDARRARRRRAVKVLGCACIAGLCALAASCLATSTAARDAIASWGTMGSVSQARLTTPSLEDADLPQREFPMEATLIAWPMGPAPAELSRDADAVAEPSVPAPAVQPRAVPRPAPARESRGYLDDPYAGAPPRVRDALSDPY